MRLLSTSKVLEMTTEYYITFQEEPCFLHEVKNTACQIIDHGIPSKKEDCQFNPVLPSKWYLLEYNKRCEEEEEETDNLSDFMHSSILMKNLKKKVLDISIYFLRPTTPYHALQYLSTPFFISISQTTPYSISKCLTTQ